MSASSTTNTHGQIATDAATTRRSRLFFRKRAEMENTPLRERTGGTRASGAGSQVWT